IGGDYLHRSGATLAFELGQRMDVNGRVEIGGGTAHVTGVRSGYTAQSREVFLFGAGGVDGSFDTLTWADSIFLEGALGYGAQEVWLAITRLDVAATAAAFGRITPAALASAERVERAFKVLDGVQRGSGTPVDEGFIRVAGDLQRIDTQSRASQ